MAQFRNLQYLDPVTRQSLHKRIRKYSKFPVFYSRKGAELENLLQSQQTYWLAYYAILQIVVQVRALLTVAQIVQVNPSYGLTLATACSRWKQIEDKWPQLCTPNLFCPKHISYFIRCTHDFFVNVSIFHKLQMCQSPNT